MNYNKSVILKNKIEVIIKKDNPMQQFTSEIDKNYEIVIYFTFNITPRLVKKIHNELSIEMSMVIGIVGNKLFIQIY